MQTMTRFHFLFIFFFFYFLCFSPSNIFSDDPSSYSIGMIKNFNEPNSPSSIIYEGASLYFNHINQQGGIHGKSVNIISHSLIQSNADIPSINMFLDKFNILFSYYNYNFKFDHFLRYSNNYKKDNIINLFPISPHLAIKPHFNSSAYYLDASYESELNQLFTSIDLYLKISNITIIIDNESTSYFSEHCILNEAYKKNISISSSFYLNSSFNIKKLSALIKKTTPKLIYIVQNSPKTFDLILSLRSDFPNIPIILSSFTNLDLLIKQINTLPSKEQNQIFQNIIFTHKIPYYNDSRFHAVREYQLFLKKAGQEPSFLHFRGFLNARLLTALLKKAPLNFTLKDLKLVLKSFKNNLGINQDVDFTDTTLDDHIGLSHVYFSSFKNQILTPTWKKNND